MKTNKQTNKGRKKERERKRVEKKERKNIYLSFCWKVFVDLYTTYRISKIPKAFIFYPVAMKYAKTLV